MSYVYLEPRAVPERKTWQVTRDASILIVSVGIVAVFNRAMITMVNLYCFAVDVE